MLETGERLKGLGQNETVADCGLEQDVAFLQRLFCSVFPALRSRDVSVQIVSALESVADILGSCCISTNSDKHGYLVRKCESEKDHAFD